ncbi:hypothetical protein [Vibrio phage vB_VmeM-Yong XC32]|nr:hypothetical protein [Vibrio phage vB_VmeM-Yong XC31]QAX96564.1 hypothetical protein [Vibrio phage vB_VmeM-Yong XC32]QAX96882.1 hypothetical protein [Vibrio phage vB_VmeM-Yong MS31]QAX97187.1 hypothetical protein [Vibrio phage vB_VmeM-Yong MS32]
MNVSTINGLMKDTIAQMKAHHPTPGIVFCHETGLMYKAATLADSLPETTYRIPITGYTDQYWISPELGDLNIAPHDSTRVYAKGDLIRFGNIYLKANGANGPLPNPLIGTETSRWTPIRFALDASDEENFKGSWQSSFNYKLGDYIYAGNGLFLICTTDHTSSSATNFNDAVYNPGATDTDKWRAYFQAWPDQQFDPNGSKATVIKPGLVPKLPADPNLALKSDGEWGAVIEGWTGSKAYPADALTFHKGIQWKANGATSRSTFMPGTTGDTWKPIVSGEDVTGFRGLWRDSIAYNANDVVISDDAEYFAVCIGSHAANTSTPFQTATTSNTSNWYVGPIKLIGSTLIAARNIMKGATASHGGSSGSVPAPTSSDRGKVLRGNATWGKPVPDYVASEAYAAGDLVVYQGQVFEANGAIAANTTWAVGNTGATWKIHIGLPVVVHEDTNEKYVIRLNNELGLFLRKYGVA